MKIKGYSLSEIQDLLENWEYTPENRDEDDEVIRFMDLIEIANGSLHVALYIKGLVEWQHPSTLLEEGLNEGEIVEINGQYLLTDDYSARFKHDLKTVHFNLQVEPVD